MEMWKSIYSLVLFSHFYILTLPHSINLLKFKKWNVQIKIPSDAIYTSDSYRISHFHIITSDSYRIPHSFILFQTSHHPYQPLSDLPMEILSASGNNPFHLHLIFFSFLDDL